MRTTMIMTAAALTLGLGGLAMAGDTDARCARDTASRSVAASTVQRALEDLGYRIDRVEAEHGCWEIRAVNDSGYPIEVTYDAATGELLQAKLR
jgi:hypothetical protein